MPRILSQTVGIDCAFEKGVAAREHVPDGDKRGQRGEPVPPGDPVTKALCDRIQQEAEKQHERDMDATQNVRRHDPVGRIQVEQRHHHRNRGDERSQCAAEAVKSPFLLFDVVFGLLQCLRRDDRGVHVRRPNGVPHVRPSAALAAALSLF